MTEKNIENEFIECDISSKAHDNKAYYVEYKRICEEGNKKLRELKIENFELMNRKLILQSKLPIPIGFVKIEDMFKCVREDEFYGKAKISSLRWKIMRTKFDKKCIDLCKKINEEIKGLIKQNRKLRDEIEWKIAGDKKLPMPLDNFEEKVNKKLEKYKNLLNDLQNEDLKIILKSTYEVYCEEIEDFKSLGITLENVKKIIDAKNNNITIDDLLKFNKSRPKKIDKKIIELWKEGKKAKEIEKIVPRSKSTIYKVIGEYKNKISNSNDNFQVEL